MRGVSPVVATILMVAIAIAAAVVAYSWFSSVQASLQSKAGEQAGTLSSVRFEIVGAECNTASGDVTVYVHNLSDTTLNESAVAVLKSADGAVKETSTLPLVVAVNEVNKFTVNFSSCSSGDTIELRVGTFTASARVQ